MTALHWATRQKHVQLVWEILGLCPGLADRATRMHRNPSCWTPLMILADSMVPSGRDRDESASCEEAQIAAALASHMTLTGLSVQSGTYATVTHLAAGRAKLHIIKKVLWRMNDLGGKAAVIQHLGAQNGNVVDLVVRVRVTELSNTLKNVGRGRTPFLSISMKQKEGSREFQQERISFRFTLQAQGRTALDIAFRCNMDVAKYLQWWEAPSNIPPPEKDETAYRRG